MASASVHHIELWVPDYEAARPRWNWLLATLGWADFQDWPGGHSWRAADGVYLVIEQSPDLKPVAHDRLRPGLNHLALTAASADVVDALATDASSHGWSLLFGDAHPFAGGPGHYAAYLEDAHGFEVEVVAPSRS